jgi:hypothetical protein
VTASVVHGKASARRGRGWTGAWSWGQNGGSCEEPPGPSLARGPQSPPVDGLPLPTPERVALLTSLASEVRGRRRPGTIARSASPLRGPRAVTVVPWSCMCSVISAPGKRSPPGASSAGRPASWKRSRAARVTSKMTEIPHGRRLLARTWLENGQPDYHVVADGHWLVFDVSLAALYTLTGGERDLPARSPISRSADRAARPYT